MMNPIDAVVMALSPATPFNPQSKVWRSAEALAQFAGITKPELQDLIAGDLAAQIICKPSKKPEKGFLVALKAQLPAEAPALPEAEDLVADEVPGPTPEPEAPGGGAKTSDEIMKELLASLSQGSGNKKKLYKKLYGILPEGNYVKEIIGGAVMSQAQDAPQQELPDSEADEEEDF